MRTFTFVIRKETGLSSEAAAVVCNEAERYDSHVCVERGSMRLSAQSIMGLIALKAACGDELRFIIYGEDEKAAEQGMKRVLAETLGAQEAGV